jgi:hypothetical protein
VARACPARLARALAPAAIVLAAPLLAPAPLGAQPAAPMGRTYRACYVPSSGTVYIVGEPGTPTTCGSTRKVPDVAVHLYDGGDALRSSTAAGGDVTGTFGALSVAALRGRALATTPPADGQTLRWNAEASVWEPATLAAGGVTDHAQLTGLTTGDPHTQYLRAGGARAAVDGFAVTGTVNQGQLAATGPGTRLLWYPRKAAFRVGSVTNDQWDDANIGDNSSALGGDVIASGPGAVALGYQTVASGWRSLALGQNSRAAGGNSVAIGYQSEAEGNAAIAIGQNVWATGARSMALGNHVSTFNHAGALTIGDAGDGSMPSTMRANANNQFSARFAGGYRLFSSGDLTSGVSLAAGGGSWQSVSDVRKKTAFRDVEGEAVLAKLAAMPVRTWQYKAQDAAIRHMGPTAQDFHRAFGLGESDTTITTVDADGVALAAARALEARTRAVREELAALRAANQALRAENVALRRRQQATEGALAARLVRLERALDVDGRAPARAASATRRTAASAPAAAADVR